MTKFWLTTGNILKCIALIIENEEIKLFFFYSSNRDQFHLDKLHVHILHILIKLIIRYI